MAYIDKIIVISYLLICLCIGFYKIRRIKNIKEFTIGKGDFSTSVLVATIFATFVGSVTIIGELEQIFQLGLLYIVARLFFCLGWILMPLLIGKNIHKFRDCISITDIMYKLYGKLGKFITNFSIMLVTIGLLGIQAIATGYLFHYFFGCSYLLGIIIGFGVLVLYSAFGGIQAVAMTDVLQFIIFFITIPIALGIMYSSFPSLDFIINKIHQSNFNLSLYYDGSLSTFFSIAIFYSIILFSEPTQIQRALMAKNKSQMYKAFYLVAVITFVFLIIHNLLAVGLYLKYPEVESKLTLYKFIQDSMPIGMNGLLIICVLAVIMSSVDSWLNTASSIFTNDIIKPIIKNMNERQELLIARVMTFLIAILASVVAIYNEKVIELFFSAYNFFYPIVAIPLISGLIGLKVKKSSFLIGVILGIIATILTGIINKQLDIYSILIGTLFNGIGFFTTQYFLSTYIKKNKINIIQNSVNYINPIKEIYNKTFNNTIMIDEIFYSSVYYFCILFILQSILLFVFTPIHSNPLIILEVIGLLFCFCLCFKDHFSKYISASMYKKFIKVVLYYCLFFMNCYPVFISYNKLIWVFNILVSIIICWTLIKNKLEILKALVLNFFVGCLVSNYIHNYSNIKLIDYGLYNSVMLLMVLIQILYLNKKHKNLILETIRYYTGVIAHEISPLMQQIQSIVRKERMEEKEKENILRISNEALEVTETILKNVKKPELNNNHSFDVKEVISRIIREYPFESYEEGIVQIKIKDNYELIGDKKHFQQAIINMVRNALQYIDESKDKNEIIISVYKEKGEKIIEIYDNGYGIKRGDIGSLYKPLFTTRKAGTGLGLYYCYNTIVNMGGTIECDSEEKQYTKFFIKF